MNTLKKYIEQCIRCAEMSPSVAPYFMYKAKGAVELYEEQLREKHMYDEAKKARQYWSDEVQGVFDKISADFHAEEMKKYA